MTIRPVKTAGSPVASARAASAICSTGSRSPGRGVTLALIASNEEVRDARDREERIHRDAIVVDLGGQSGREPLERRLDRAVVPADTRHGQHMREGRWFRMPGQHTRHIDDPAGPSLAHGGERGLGQLDRRRGSPTPSRVERVGRVRSSAFPYQAIAALFTSTSIGPSAILDRGHHAARESGSARSATTGYACPPKASIAATVDCSETRRHR